MDKADSDRIREICALINVEQDRKKFSQLLEELNRILDRTVGRRQERDPAKSD